MCLAYPGTVISIKGSVATIKYVSLSPRQCEERAIPESPRETVAIQSRKQESIIEKKVFLGDTKVKVGDRVLVQMGIVIKVLTKKEDTSILSAWSCLN